MWKLMADLFTKMEDGSPPPHKVEYLPRAVAEGQPEAFLFAV